MLLGKYEHQLDDKNRLTLPSKIRNKLSGIVYLSRGFEGSLELRSEAEFLTWTEELEKLESFKKDVRALQRYIFANSVDLEIDAAGRIQIPKALLAAAQIEKTVLILGVGSKVEIWSKATYLEYEAQNLTSIEEVAEEIKDLGK